MGQFRTERRHHRLPLYRKGNGGWGGYGFSVTDPAAGFRRCLQNVLLLTVSLCFSHYLSEFQKQAVK